jgi:AAA domain
MIYLCFGIGSKTDNDTAGEDHATSVARSLVGVAASVRILRLPGLPPKGDVTDWLEAGGTRDELERLAREAPEYRPDEAVDDDDLEFVQLEAIHPTLIPPRPWAYDHFLMFGTAGVIGAMDGTGKGSIAVSMLIACITGKEVLGEKVWRTGPVAIVSYEDPPEEWHRRIAAACLKFEVDYEYVIANVRFIDKPDGKVTFAQRAQEGGLLFPDGDKIIKGLRKLSAAWLIVDPFNTAHELDDGNNNVLIARVAYEVSRIAKEANVAALVLHHLRKGSVGSVDDLMGATSLRANFRACRIFARMSEEESKKLGIDDTERWRYLRIAGTKLNFAPPPEKATWLQLASVPLYNGTTAYPDGDELGVVMPWKPPSPFADMDVIVIRNIMKAFRDGPQTDEPGWFYGLAKNSKFWAGKVLVGLAQVHTEERAAVILKVWKDKGLITEEEYETPHRKKANRVVPNNALVSQFMTPEWASSDGL